MRRFFLIATGYLCIVLAVVGIFLPLLPTTPFLLAAMVLFAKSSPERAKKLENNRFLGEYIKCYTQGTGMNLRYKVQTIILLWASISLSALYLIDTLWVRVLLFIIAVAVTIHVILIRPSRPKGSE